MASQQDESNPFAAPKSDLNAEAYADRSDQVVYGSFGSRFVAAFADGIITNIIGSVAGFGLGIVLVSANGGNEIDETMARVSGGLLGIIIAWLYSELQESSEAQATLGKKMMGLRVTDLDGRRISFARATGRHFGKLLSMATLFIRFLMQQFTAKRQALHDIMAGTLVIKK